MKGQNVKTVTKSQSALEALCRALQPEPTIRDAEARKMGYFPLQEIAAKIGLSIQQVTKKINHSKRPRLLVTSDTGHKRLWVK